MSPTSVFLIDDNRPFLRVLTRFLEETCGENLRVVGAVSDPNAAVLPAVAAQPEVVLLDLNMPEIAGYDLLPRLRKALPRAILVVVTMVDEDFARKAARTLGADGFVVKAKLEHDLVPTLTDLIAVRDATA